MKRMRKTYQKIYPNTNKKKTECKWCGRTYYKTSNSQKYCCDECREYAELENCSKRVAKYRKKYDKRGSDWIGTGHLGEHCSLNEDTEADLIEKEFKRLNLKRKY